MVDENDDDAFRIDSSGAVLQTVQAAARDGDDDPVWAAWPVTWNLCPLPALGVDSTGFTHEGLKASRRYRYQVQATNAHGDSEWSASFPESGLNPVPAGRR